MGNKSTREILLQTALNLFYQKGYLSTSIREIGAEAGMSNSIIYHYFKNKEELLFEIVNNTSQKLIQALQEIQERISDPLECLRQMLTEHSLFFGLKLKKEAKIFESDHYFVHGKHQETIRAQQRKIYDLYKNKMRELVDKGVLKDVDLTVANFSIFGTINSSFHWFKDGGRLSRDEVVQNILKFVFYGILNLKE